MSTGESSEFDALHHRLCINFLNALIARNFKDLGLIWRKKCCAKGSTKVLSGGVLD